MNQIVLINSHKNNLFISKRRKVISRGNLKSFLLEYICFIAFDVDYIFKISLLAVGSVNSLITYKIFLFFPDSRANKNLYF